MRRIERREFARHASLAFLGGVTVTMSACGGGGYSSPTTSSPAQSPGDEVGQISANHGHRAVITAAELMAGGALKLDIRGDADHTHTVDLPAQAVQDVREGKPVQTQSTTTQSHAHGVTFHSESPDPPARY